MTRKLSSVRGSDHQRAIGLLLLRLNGNLEELGKKYPDDVLIAFDYRGRPINSSYRPNELYEDLGPRAREVRIVSTLRDIPERAERYRAKFNLRRRSY